MHFITVNYMIQYHNSEIHFQAKDPEFLLTN